MLNLKLHSVPDDRQDYHLIIEVDLAKWQQLQQLATPWYLQLAPARIFLLDTKIF
jgi:hypothetical protein